MADECPGAERRGRLRLAGVGAALLGGCYGAFGGVARTGSTTGPEIIASGLMTAMTPAAALARRERVDGGADGDDATEDPWP